jgi:hypothetical protein
MKQFFSKGNSVLCADAELNGSGSYRVKIWCSQASTPAIEETAALSIQIEAHPVFELDRRVNGRSELEAYITQFAKANLAHDGIYWLRKGQVTTKRTFDSCEEMIDHILVNITAAEKSQGC